MKKAQKNKEILLFEKEYILSDLLTIGASGLNAAKKSIQTTSHNISNVNTEGFTRKHAHKETEFPLKKGNLIMGSGVKVSKIDRSVNPYIEKKLNLATSEHSFYKERTNQLTQVESLFNTLEVEGLHKILNNFYNSFRELSNHPEDQAIRSVVRDKAQLVIEDFKKIRQTIDKLSYAIDSQIEKEISDANGILQDIANLNVKIVEAEVLSNSEAGDLRDERDLKIRELSKFFRIHIYEEEKGALGIIAAGVGNLVSKGLAQKFNIKRYPKEESSNNLDGGIEIHFQSRPTQSISTKFSSGRLSSLLRVRNYDHKLLRKNIDDIAYELIQTVNSIHRSGYVARKISLNKQGHPIGQDSKGPTTGVNFFAPIRSRDEAALRINLSEDVNRDISNIVTALTPNGPRDNRVALAISKLQYEKIMSDGSDTLEDYYLKQITKIGLELAKAKTDVTQAKGVLSMANNLRERVSGVGLDEEAANLVRFQKSYEASAKVINTSEEMFDTILEMKR